MFDEYTKLFSNAQVLGAIHKVAIRLTDHLEHQCAKREIIFIIVLKSGAKFAFTLFDNLFFPFKYSFVHTRERDIDKYRKSLGMVDFLYYNLKEEPIDNNVIVMVDSICDSGATLKALDRRLRGDFKPREVLSCILVKKNQPTGPPSRRSVIQPVPYQPEFWALETPKDKFIVGWGIGLEERHRNLTALHEIPWLEKE